LSIDHDFPRSAIDHSAIARALERGALDDCLYALREADQTGLDAGRLNCRLAETLFHEGRFDDALECGRRAFAIAGDDEGVAHCCAWLFSNCGCHAEAAEAYERLLDHHPDWVEGYRHLSGSLTASGDHGAAIACAAKASDLAPDNFEFAFHAGCLLIDAERVEEAALYLARAIDIDPGNPRALRALSAAGLTLDRPDEALDLALRAATLAPADNDIAIHAAELLLRAGRIDDAIGLLEGAIGADPANPLLWRLISAAQAQRDDVGQALAAIGRALQLHPDNAEYHLHRGHLLYRLGDFAEAAEAFNPPPNSTPRVMPFGGRRSTRCSPRAA
jgi:tetratricopeptide (TPR) repeat protein